MASSFVELSYTGHVNVVKAKKPKPFLVRIAET
jgi:hypothetical protein